MKKKIGLLMSLILVLVLSGCQTTVKEEAKETPNTGKRDERSSSSAKRRV